jgi:hypothetical protein
VWGYASSTVTTSQIWLNINGTDVVGPLTVTAVTNSLLIDYIANLTPNTSYTIHVDGVTGGGGVTLYINQVSITAGFGLTSTTSVSILSITLDSANDVYTLNVSGNFVYSISIRVWVKGNRKTKTNATISTSLTNSVYIFPYQPSAGDDGDNNAFLASLQGDYASSFTVSGYVGASNDVIIITGIYCQIVIKDNRITIYENGVAFIVVRMVTYDGTNQADQINIITSNNIYTVYRSPNGTDIIYSTQLASASRGLRFEPTSSQQSIYLYVNIVIIGV